MRNIPSPYEPIPPRYAQTIRNLGIDLTDIETITAHFVRRPKGNILHTPQCSSIKDIDATHVNVPILTRWDQNFHTQCTRWGWYWNGNTEKLGNLLHLAHLQQQVDAAIKSGDKTHLATAKELCNHPDIRAAGEALEYESWIDEQHTRVENATPVELSDTEKIAPHIAMMLAMPEKSAETADAALGDGSITAVRRAWRHWQEHLTQGAGLKNAEAAAEKLLPAHLKSAPLLKLWKRTLQRTAAHATTQEVYYALQITTYGVRTAEKRLARILAQYPHSRHDDGAYSWILLRIPEAVACDMSEHNYGNAHWLGTPGDDPAHILETLPAIWASTKERNPAKLLPAVRAL